ncbi:MAG: glucose-6-phosphate dehydrogenase assembly protein OpcA [Bifidobacteriaceae bacterium]|nr:glucose-6-phosphate dehydrogenase assembly protein OpcA [Bifidobacteriaceae bacterium]
MIIDMPNTHTRDIASKIDELHDERGEAATGRVLTLLISTDKEHLEDSLSIANSASLEHPCRVIAIVIENESEENEHNLCAQVRFGADAGAGEIIILYPHNGLVNHLDSLVIPLLIPDTPIVAWWPTNPPADPSKDLLGAMARTRITDVQKSDNPRETFERLLHTFNTKDIDLSWTRITVWRAMLASLLDQPPHEPITHIEVCGPRNTLPLQLLATWLHSCLNAPITITYDDSANAISAVRLTRSDGVLSVERPEGSQAVIHFPGQTPQPIILPVRTQEECLAEELRRMDPDIVYSNVLHKVGNLSQE